MRTLAQLKQVRAQALLEARKISGGAEREGRAMTEAERRSVRGHLDEAANLALEIEARGLTEDDVPAEWRGRHAYQQQRGAPNPPSLGPTGEAASTRDMDFAFGQFLQRVAIAGSPGNQVPPEILQRAATGMNETVGSEGGFLVGTTESDQLLQRVYTSGQITSRVRRLPSLQPGTNGVEIPYLDETSRANGSRLGGVQMYWQDEAEQMTASKPKLGKMELRLKKITGLCYATDESLQDARQLGAIIADSFRKEMVFSLEDAIFRGSGAGRPLGWMNSPCKITVSKEGSQASATITFNNVAAMLARLNPGSMASAVWLANISTLPQLLKMSVPITNLAGTENVGGSGVGLIYDANQQRLLGKPVLFCEYPEALGTEGDLVLADLGEYLIIDREAQSASSIHVRFDYNETAFRFVYRVDGQPAQKTALTPYKGSATTSPFITLQTR